MTSLVILNFFGSVLLLLYGIHLGGEGLQRAVGGKLRGFLLSAAGGRVRGVISGAAMTACLQSSSATTIMLAGFAGSGLMGLKETMGIILGADIGTTITVQVIAFRIYDYAIAIVGAGALVRFLARSGPIEDAGKAILGFGLVFLALKMLIDAFSPLSADPRLGDFLLRFGSDPLAGIIIAALVTALLQSSAATVALAISAAHSGVITLDAAIPVVLGANIGTCVGAAVSSIGAPMDSKRVALAHVLFKVAGVVVVLPVIGPFTSLVGVFSADVAREIAIAHTLFNLGIAAVFLPFTGQFARLVYQLVPERAMKKRFGPKYLDPIVLSTPTLALGQATREALRLAEITEEMLRDSIEAFKKDDSALIERIEERDNDVDLLDREIKLYLTKLSREALSDEQARREFEILAFTNNMENIGDVIDKNLMELARKKTSGARSFSAEGLNEIISLHERVVENFKEGVAVFATSDEELARRLLSHKARLSELERELKEAHIGRLHRGLRESIDTSAIHLDVLTNLKRINSYVSNIAYAVVEGKKKREG
jgi:phosphate:Na+ symporter